MGLEQVRELTRRTTASILSAREERPFGSLDDLLRRARPRLGEAKNLVKAGALDGLGASRKAQLAQLKGRRSSAPLQATLPFFQADGYGDADTNDTLLERLSWEQEMLGWPVSDHPLRAFPDKLASLGVVRSDALVERAGASATIAGARLALWGERRGTFTLEDEAGLITVRLPAGQRPPRGVMGKLGPYWARGRVHLDRTGEVLIQADKIEPL
jgi:DNA polymerase III alpha subunit